MANKKTVGRPSKYNDELQDKADQYIYNFHEQGDVVPSQAGLCCWLGVSRSTLFEWSKEYPLFSSTLEAISVLQENLALNRSLDGKFNSTIAKLLLANHGYSDKQELAHTSPDGSMSPRAGLNISKLSTAAMAEILAAKDAAER